MKDSALTDAQARVLRKIVDAGGKKRAAELNPSIYGSVAKLKRRGYLDHWEGLAGLSLWYQITPAGREALAEYEKND